MTYDFSFEGHRRSVGGMPRRSVNVDMDWEKLPGGELGRVFDAILKCILGLRAIIGVGARILIQNMDFNGICRQVGMTQTGGERAQGGRD